MRCAGAAAGSAFWLTMTGGSQYFAHFDLRDRAMPSRMTKTAFAAPGLRGDSLTPGAENAREAAKNAKFGRGMLQLPFAASRSSREASSQSLQPTHAKPRRTRKDVKGLIARGAASNRLAKY